MSFPDTPSTGIPTATLAQRLRDCNAQLQEILSRLNFLAQRAFLPKGSIEAISDIAPLAGLNSTSPPASLETEIQAQEEGNKQMYDLVLRLERIA